MKPARTGFTLVELMIVVASFGEMHVNCLHTDTKGTSWAEY